mgnify:CR=1 FL=1
MCILIDTAIQLRHKIYTPVPVTGIFISHQAIEWILKVVLNDRGKNKKVLNLDLDNTLWGGIVGDDGADNIEIGQETSLAQT